MKSTPFSAKQVKHVAKLANLNVSLSETKLFAKQFSETIVTIDKLNELNTKKVSTTYQVTGLKNITRKDQIDKQRMLSQKQALSRAKKTHQGYFVVANVLTKNA